MNRADRQRLMTYLERGLAPGEVMARDAVVYVKGRAYRLESDEDAEALLAVFEPERFRAPFPPMELAQHGGRSADLPRIGRLRFEAAGSVDERVAAMARLALCWNLLRYFSTATLEEALAAGVMMVSVSGAEPGPWTIAQALKRRLNVLLARSKWPPDREPRSSPREAETGKGEQP